MPLIALPLPLPLSLLTCVSGLFAFAMARSAHYIFSNSSDWLNLSTYNVYL